MFKKILIANRGEIAVRIIRACKELKIKTVAVHSTADEASLHVHMADEAVCIGPPPPRDSYLNDVNIISAALITGADAIHPGIGFLSERASFAEACEAHGLKFIGPSAAVMERMGDKAVARETMRAAGVPVVPGTPGAGRQRGGGPALCAQNRLSAADQSRAWRRRARHSPGAERRGTAASVRHGAHGSRLRRSASPMCIWKSSSRSRAISRCRFSPMNTGMSCIWASANAPFRTCAIRNSSKNRPADKMPAVSAIGMGDAAVKAASAIGYTNAGTVEFLVDANGEFYFMEMNKRLQVEHCVTEALPASIS